MRTWKMQSRLLFACAVLAATACSDSPLVTSSEPLKLPTTVPLADHNTAGFGALPGVAGTDIRPGPATVTVNGALWTSAFPFGVGTGQLDPFLSIQAAPEEDGFNSDGVWDLDQTRTQFTDALPLNNVPIINDGGQWREFILDANEANSAPDANFSIDLFKMYVCQDAAAPTYTTAQFLAAITGGQCILAYSSTSGTGAGPNTGYLRATDSNTQGSGNTLDYRILIPASFFGATANAACPYNPTAAACGYYIVLYSHMGGVGGDFVTGSTFEEYSTIKRPFVAPTKTAVPTFTRTYPWTIDKSVTPSPINLWNGDNQNANYTVTVTPTTPVDGSWAVSGTITIGNPSGDDATIASVTDQMNPGALNATVVCPETFPFVLGNGDELVCTYSRSLPDATTRTNTATITLAEGTVSTATAQVVFSTPTTEVNKTVHVTDTYLFPGGTTTALGTATAPTPAVFNYPRNFACPADVGGPKTNRAIITETGQFDDASVTVNCFNLTVTKTATPAQGDVFDWTVDKTVTPASRTMYTGDQGEFQYTVTYTKTGPTSTRSVTGTVTVTNPASSSGNVTVNSIPTDQVIAVGANLAIPVTLTCAGTVFPKVLAPNTNFVCTYGPVALPNGDARTNRATATGTIASTNAHNNKDFSGDAAISFAGVTPTTQHNSATITDPNDPLTPRGPFTASGSFQYINTHNCGITRTIPNTVTLTTNNALVRTDDATITITCVAPTVVKTAATSYRRTWTWDILKERGIGEPVSLNLQPGQSYIYDFNVNVFTTGNTVDLAEAHGNITVTGQAGVPGARSFTVTDVLSGTTAPVIVCPGGLNPFSLTGAGPVVCTWSKDLGSDISSRTNVATATLQNVKYQIVGGPTNLGTTPFSSSPPTAVTFAATATVLRDECVKVGDIAQHKLLPGATNLGAAIINNLTNNQFTQCVNNGTSTGAANLDLPYTTTIGPMNQFAACGLFRLDNTATLTTVDLGLTDNSSLQTPITVDCPSGCTLTQGYWKTHNALFGIKPQGRKGPPIHDWTDAPLWTDWQAWRFFGGTPAPVPPGVTAVNDPPDGAPSWFTTFVTPPKGNAYYQAAHQFMAAMLNVANGASGAVINTELANAYNYFLTATPADGEDDRAQLLAWSSLFGSYNEGDIGPGHCDEDQTSQQ